MIELIICGFVFSVLALAASFVSIVKVTAFEKSTHKIEWRTVPDSQEAAEIEKLLYKNAQDEEDDMI